MSILILLYAAEQYRNCVLFTMAVLDNGGWSITMPAEKVKETKDLDNIDFMNIEIENQHNSNVFFCKLVFELTHYHTMPHFDALKIYSCGKHCEKRRNCL